MVDKKELEKIFRKHSLDDFRWIDPKKVVVSEWVRIKCIFGCDGYGESACCPPNVPSVQECERFLREYEAAVLFHFAAVVPELDKRRRWSARVNKVLVELEREVFLAGNQKAFMLPMASCRFCKECNPSRLECKDKTHARPTPEAFAVDVFSTARAAGYPIKVVTDYKEKMNRYAILLIK